MRLQQHKGLKLIEIILLGNILHGLCGPKRARNKVFQVLGKIYPFFEFFSMKFLGKVLGFSGRNHLNK